MEYCSVVERNKLLIHAVNVDGSQRHTHEVGHTRPHICGSIYMTIEEANYRDRTRVVCGACREEQMDHNGHWGPFWGEESILYHSCDSGYVIV